MTGACAIALVVGREGGRAAATPAAEAVEKAAEPVVQAATSVAGGSVQQGDVAGMVVVAEATRPDLDADDLCTRIAAEAPGTRVVLLCAREDHEVAVRCLRAGAVGYLARDADLDSLARVLRGVSDGEAAVSHQLTTALVEALRDCRSRLTAREWEVVDLLDEGASTEGIAEHPMLAPATVHSHIKHVMAKLQGHSRDDAVHAAMRLRREEAALTV